MTGAGLKKCSPTTRAGSAAALARAVMGIDEVFEARTACGAAAETAARTSRFRASASGAA
jgi:hypothetical protein